MNWMNFDHQRLPKDLLTFKTLKGRVVAIKPFSNAALLNTYENFRRTLDEVRTLVKQERDISVKKLRATFKDTELGRIASIADWQEWISSFGASGAHSGNVTLVFLERACGLDRNTIKKNLSGARQ
jgi:hypothetical protein